jgi:hypothetical protein
MMDSISQESYSVKNLRCFVLAVWILTCANFMAYAQTSLKMQNGSQ